MKKMFIKSLLAAATVMLVSLPQQVKASEFSFAVDPVKPKTQVNKKVTYFDIAVKPKEEQVLKVKLRNDTAKPVDVDAVVNTTTTNLNGVVEYSPNNIKNDKTLKYDIKDLVEFPKDITIPKQSEKTVEFKVNAPSEAFDGVISGGITFKDKDKTKDDKKAGSGLSINNEFSYVVAMVLHSKDTKIEKELKLLDVYADQVNVRNTIRLKFQNPQPVFLNNLRYKAEITKENDSTVLYHTEKKGMQVAPNSNFSSPISLEGDKLNPGKYTAKVTALAVEASNGEYPSEEKGPDGKVLRYLYKWDFTKNFEITSEVAKNLNAKDVTIKKTMNVWAIAAICLLLLLLLILIIYLIKKRLDKKRQAEKEEINDKE